MYHLVAQYRRQFRLALQLHQQAPIHRNLAARQRPGIGDRTVEHLEFVWQLSVGYRRKLLTHFVYVQGEIGQ
jgi:hypothetical protein